MTEWETSLKGIIFQGPGIEDAFLIGGATKSPNMHTDQNRAFFVSLSDAFTSVDLVSSLDLTEHTASFSAISGLFNAPTETLTQYKETPTNSLVDIDTYGMEIFASKEISISLGSKTISDKVVNIDQPNQNFEFDDYILDCEDYRQISYSVSSVPSLTQLSYSNNHVVLYTSGLSVADLGTYTVTVTGELDGVTNTN